MSSLLPLHAAWNEACREYLIALQGLPDEDVWRRAHPRLWSVGELTGHVAYWQAVWFLGTGEDRPNLETLPVSSPLIDPAFRYYDPERQAGHAVTLDAEGLRRELLRVQDAARQVMVKHEQDGEYPGMWRTWGNLLQYQAFHLAYHAGQVYSVRHLLGHQTEDN